MTRQTSSIPAAFSLRADMLRAAGATVIAPKPGKAAKR